MTIKGSVPRAGTLILVAQPLLLASPVAWLDFSVAAGQRRWETRQTCHPSTRLNTLRSERAATILAKTSSFCFSRKLHDRWLHLRENHRERCVCGGWEGGCVYVIFSAQQSR